jgi:PhnB protein
MAVKPVPEGYHTVTPYLISQDADQLLAFVKKAFGAKENEVMRAPDGSIWHADLTVGTSHIMVSQASAQYPAMQAGIYLYVPDTDTTYRAALAAGATSTMEPADQFYGDRTAGVKDSQGNMWWIGTHVEDVSPEELARRSKAVAEQRAAATTKG